MQQWLFRAIFLLLSIGSLMLVSRPV